MLSKKRSVSPASAARRFSSKSGNAEGSGNTSTLRRYSHADEVGYERLRAGISQHARDLPFQRDAVLQSATFGQIEELVIGIAAPEENDRRDASSTSLMR